MKKSKFLAVVAFLAAVASVFAFTPPPTPYGKHSTLGAIAGTIVGANDCDKTLGSQCKVRVGTGPNEQIVDAFNSQPGAAAQDDNARMYRNP